MERGLKEGTNLVVEGVHLVPEIIPPRYLEHPNVCTLVVYLSDENVHRSRFYIRALGTAMRRPAEEYISHFHQIRQIHDYIFESAGRAGVNAVENLSIENTSDAVVEIVANRVQPGEGEGPGAFYAVNIDLPQPGRWQLTVLAGADEVNIPVEAGPSATPVSLP